MSAATNLPDVLDVRAGEPGDLVLRRATLLDPVAGIDGVHDLVIRGGRIAELAPPGEADASDCEELDAEGLHAFPAFFDPHVHLRTPGQEHKEDVETGTRAAAARGYCGIIAMAHTVPQVDDAAADPPLRTPGEEPKEYVETAPRAAAVGGYCGIIAMANTVPPVDDAAAVTALREQARAQASVPVGFSATVTVGMKGQELTDMVELREAGAVALTDDGLPIASARVMRRALQYQHLAGLNIALPEQDPELSAGGVMHEGAVSAARGLGGWPSVAESTMIARHCAPAA